MMPRPPSCAPRASRDHRLEVGAGEDRGQRLDQPRTPLPGTYGVAKSAAFALLARDASG